MRQPVPFGKYILLDRISVGGMAEVFKAKSFGVEGFEKIIAVKRILPSMGEDKDFIDMFVDEAKIAGQLAHANICQIFELGRIDGTHFIAMEYIWGKDLLQIQNRLRKHKQTMDIAMACFIMAKVCEGLDYAHRKRDALGRPMNIVHRDCSPQNILISYEGEVKLIDFGIAKAASRSSKTVAGVLKGKFGYMSPEQVRGLALDRRSDIFACGTVLYECITGERLFQCESDFSTLEKVRNVSIFPPSHFNRNIPEELERIVMKALARNPEDRYQWASEMQADLQQVLMKQERVFTAKALGAWLKDMFAAERERERKMLERYRAIGPDGRVRADAGPGSDTLDAPVASLVDGGRGRRATSDFDDGPTEVFGELTVDESPRGAAARAATPPAPPVPPPRAPAIADEPTAAKVVAPAESGPAQLAGSPGAADDALVVSELPPVVEEVRRAHPVLQFGPTEPVAPVAAVPAGTARRRGLMKDVGVGLGIAVGVLAVFAVVRFALLRGRPAESAPAPTATLAVTVPDGEPADVFVNGQRVGEVAGGDAFKLDRLLPGAYRVVVRRAGAPDCVRDLRLAPAALEIVTCTLQRAGPPPSFLRLAGALDGATVFLDGQQVAAESASEPMVLSPGVDHEVRIVRGDAGIQSFSVRLAPGQRTTRVVRPEPAPQPTSSGRRDGDDGATRAVRESSSFRAFVAKTVARSSRARERADRSAGAAAARGAVDQPARRGRDERGSDPAPRGDAPASDRARQAADVGYLVAWTTPWARVFIDGRDTGKMTPIAPRAKIALKPGKHRVTFVVGTQRFHYPIVVSPGETFKLRETLPVQDRR